MVDGVVEIVSDTVSMVDCVAEISLNTVSNVDGVVEISPDTVRFTPCTHLHVHVGCSQKSALQIPVRNRPAVL